jgi:hypothetical protein
MRRLRTSLLSTTSAFLLSTMSAQAGDSDNKPAVTKDYEHVLLISVDGLHAADLAKWIETHPTSTFAKLASTGIVYPNAFTTAPSDSYPGMIAQVTGASSKTAGLFYDDSYDRTSYPSRFFYTSQNMADPGCTGTIGTELTNFEAIDISYDPASGITPDVSGGGTLGQPLTQIDTNKLQRRLVNGTCQPTLPHQYIRTNTIFEVIKAGGGLTAWSDKHPAYEILSGPSGKGIDDLFAPEINAQLPGAPAGQDYTTSFSGIRTYDSIKVNAVINWIHGFNSTQTAHPGIPSVFGMNFQAVSVGQKLATAGYGDDASLTGGYLDSNATPGNALSQELQFVDDSLGKMKQELQAQGIDDATLIIVSGKHGQSPIDPKARVTQSDKPFQKIPGFGDSGFEICDDAGLIWLQPDLQKANYDAARAYLQANAAALHIQQLLDRTSLTPLYGDPFENSRVPDFIAVTDHGVICTGGSKLAEHGGFSDDDRNVALLLSAPKIKPAIVETLSYTTQIAPTILTALDLDPGKLKATRTEGTRPLSR